MQQLQQRHQCLAELSKVGIGIGSNKVDDESFVEAWALWEDSMIRKRADISTLEEEIEIIKKEIQDTADTRKQMESVLSDLELERREILKDVAMSETDKKLSNKPLPYLCAASDHYKQANEKIQSHLDPIASKYSHHNLERASHRALVSKSDKLRDALEELDRLTAQVDIYDGISHDVVQAKSQIEHLKFTIAKLDREFDALVSQVFR